MTENRLGPTAEDSPESSDSPGEAGGGYRIAVVGCGPKALFALESLVRRLRQRADGLPEIAVDLFDDNPHFGAGAAYAPDQPEYLRLNVTSKIVDAHEPHAPDRYVDSFGDWTAQYAPHLGDDSFPPRAEVGRYLQYAWERVLGAAPRTVSVTRVPSRVVSATPASTSRGWMAETDAGAEYGPYHEVLLSTGHRGEHPDALRHGWSAPVPLVPQVFPVRQWLTEDHVPVGSTVAVRGGALTFIDACLTLTQGRGGMFSTGDDGRMVYLASGYEPRAIVPITRDGLFLDAKTGASVVVDGLDELLGSAADRVRRAEDAVAVIREVEAAAAEMLGRCEAATVSDPQWEVSYTLRHGADPGSERLDRAVRVLRYSLAVAEGREAPGAAWALGRAWAQLYPAIVDRLSHREFTAQEWAGFRTVAVAMERLAFGPPPVNAAKLLALIDAGIVDTGWMHGGVQVDAGGLTGVPRDAREPDVVVDAVMAPAGIAPAGAPIYDRLLAMGTLSLAPGRRGARITACGQAVDGTGARVPGLSVLGRPTEDYVIGHDTLNRALHDTPQRWADRVAQQILGADRTERAAAAAGDATEPRAAHVPPVAVERDGGLL